MSLEDCRRFLLFIQLDRAKVPSFMDYPFCLPAVRSLDKLEFHPSVTFLIGENGAGKSTLLEAIAVKWGFNAEGGNRNIRFATRESHSELHEFMRMARGISRATDGFFLRAESFYNVATQVDEYGVAHGYGGKSLHEQSHGESFWSLFMSRFRGRGFYILDEPEAALSPSRQLALLVRMHQLVKAGSQLVIATHSPILMAYPDSLILQLAEDGIHPIPYQETEHFVLTKRFFQNPERMIAELLKEDPELGI